MKEEMNYTIENSEKIIKRYNEILEEQVKCEICGGFFDEDDLINTTGMINGGVGNCCEQCIEDGDIR